MTSANDKQSRVVLLTGGTGFLGSNLARELLANGFQVVVLKRSFSNSVRLEPLGSRLVTYDIDLVGLEQAFDDYAIGSIIHCATNYGRNDVPPSAIIEANLTLPLELLELGKQRGVSNFINTDTLLPKGVNAYSLSKSQFSEWLRYYSEAMNCVDVVIEHFYGPYDDPSKFTARVLGDVLSTVASIDLTIGEQKRDFVYISDVVSAFVKILKSLNAAGGGYERYEVGTGTSVSVREMVTLVKTLCGNRVTKLNFGALSYRPNEPMDIQVNISKLVSLGWKPTVSLRDGLQKTIEKEREKTVR